MKIRKIAIKNLNSLREESALDFTERPLAHTGLFAIIGETGAGKSTILDAITLALYGKMPRNKNVKEVLSYGAAEALAEVDFEHNAVVFRAKWSLWRSRGRVDGRVQDPRRELSRWNSKIREFEIIAEKMREVDEKVEEFTGLDYDRFRRSVLLAQGDFAAFLDADERERSELLEKITGTEVYSHLSKGAYERHKLEREKLERLKIEMDALKILSEEELKALKDQLSTLKKEVAALKKEKDELQSKTGRYEQLHQLTQKQEELNKAIKKLEEEKAKLQEDFDLLQNYEKAKVFLQELNILDERIENVKSTEEELDRISRRLSSLQEEQEAGARRNRDAIQELSRQKEKFRTLEPKWLKARELDQRIEQQQKLVKGLENEKQALQGDYESAVQRHKLTRQNLEREKQTYDQLQSWLTEHQQLERLQSNLSGLSREIRDWKDSGNDLAGMLKEQEKLHKQLIQKETEIKKLEEELQKDQSKIEALKGELKKLMPQNYALKESQLLELVHKDLDTLGAQQNELEQLRQKNQEYQKLLQEHEQVEEELEHLRAEQDHLYKELMTQWNLHDEYQKLLDYKSAIYEQQQLIVNYEKDRSELKEGDPCPLCFSTEHPFRKQSFKPFVNEARQEFEAIKKKYEEVDREFRALQRRQESLYLSLKQYTERSDNYRQQILEWEAAFEKTLEKAQTRGIELYNLGTLNQKIEENKNRLEALKSQKTQLGAILHQLEKQKDTFTKKDDRLREIKSEFRIQHSDYNNRQKQIQGQEKRVGNLQKQIDKELKHFKLSIQQQKPDKLLAQLAAWRDEFVEKGRQKVEAERRLGILNKELEQVGREQKKAAGNLEKKDKVLQQELERLSSWKNNRHHLLEDRDPDREKAAYLEQLEQLEVKKEETRSNLEEIQRQIESFSAMVKRETSALKRLQELKNEQEHNLLSGLKKVGIASIEDLRAINLSEEQVDSIRRRKEELDQQQIEYRRLIKDTETEVKQLEEMTAGWPEPETIKKRAAELDEAYSTQLKKEGALQDQLRHDEEQKGSAKALMKKLDAQHKEYDRWARLNEVIGMADGKKFRIFAQALTLEKLIFLANRHLAQLNGRYVIEKLKGDDLALEIVDTYQANHRRSMHTLSGGERFLVSLALALGLSDLAGRHSQIQSLFIDEGFGTLDDNSLDMVLSTLENLQSSGKTIGVISHVKELKERIATQIQLIKQENGFSKLKIIG